MARIQPAIDIDRMPVVNENPADPHERGKAGRATPRQTMEQRIAHAQQAITGSTVGSVKPLMDSDGDNDDD